MNTKTDISTLVVVECCSCGVRFAVPEEWKAARKRDHGWWYCPNGHTQHWPQKSEAETARDELARERQKFEQLRALRSHERAAMTDDHKRALERAKKYANNRGFLGSFWKGHEARRCGACVNSCPYETTGRASQFHRAWMDGYGADR